MGKAAREWTCLAWNWDCYLQICCCQHYSYLSDNLANHISLLFQAILQSGSLDYNNILGGFSLCTYHRCTISDHFLPKWQLTLHFVHPRCLHFWTWSHRFQGSPYNSRMDKARHREPSMLRHSLLPGRKSPLKKGCQGGSRWRCSCFSSWWRRCQRSQLRRRLWCFLGISVWHFSKTKKLPIEESA